MILSIIQVVFGLACLGFFFHLFFSFDFFFLIFDNSNII